MAETENPEAKEIEAQKRLVERVINFDPNSLERRTQLGELAFDDAIGPAKKLIGLFAKLPIDSLDEFPNTQRQQIETYANSAFSYLDEILKFSITAGGDPASAKQQLVKNLELAYQPTFTALFPFISYGVARTIDFNALETRARSAIQTIADEKGEIISQLKTTADEANKVLTSVRDAAAEQGVTQMAKYFADEAIEHQNQSKNWLKASIFMAVVVLIFALGSFFLQYLFVPKTGYESAQLIASKTITFVVLAFALFQCVRSYSAHRHNAVTNKHRQNALLTYKTLADAGNSPELRDVVLQHAAAAIYAPNDSGYLKGEERGYGAQSLMALATRSGANSGSSSP